PSSSPLAPQCPGPHPATAHPFFLSAPSTRRRRSRPQRPTQRRVVVGRARTSNSHFLPDPQDTPVARKGGALDRGQARASGELAAVSSAATRVSLPCCAP